MLSEPHLSLSLVYISIWPSYCCRAFHPPQLEEHRDHWHIARPNASLSCPLRLASCDAPQKRSCPLRYRDLPFNSRPPARKIYPAQYPDRQPRNGLTRGFAGNRCFFRGAQGRRLPVQRSQRGSRRCRCPLSGLPRLEDIVPHLRRVGREEGPCTAPGHLPEERGCERAPPGHLCNLARRCNASGASKAPIGAASPLARRCTRTVGLNE